MEIQSSVKMLQPITLTQAIGLVRLQKGTMKAIICKAHNSFKSSTPTLSKSAQTNTVPQSSQFHNLKPRVCVITVMKSMKLDIDAIIAS